MPRFKHIPEIGERIKLGYGSGGRGVRERISDSVETLDNPIFSGWYRDGAVGVPKFNCVRNNLALGIHLDEFEATEKIEGGPDIKTFFGLKVPRSPSGWLGMD